MVIAIVTSLTQRKPVARFAILMVVAGTCQNASAAFRESRTAYSTCHGILFAKHMHISRRQTVGGGQLSTIVFSPVVTYGPQIESAANGHQSAAPNGGKAVRCLTGISRDVAALTRARRLRQVVRTLRLWDMIEMVEMIEAFARASSQTDRRLSWQTTPTRAPRKCP
jgi:hypothetical protein